MVIAQVMVEALKYLHMILKRKCSWCHKCPCVNRNVRHTSLTRFHVFADDALKSMECENNLSMFKAIAHLQVGFL